MGRHGGEWSIRRRAGKADKQRRSGETVTCVYCRHAWADAATTGSQGSAAISHEG